MDVKNISKFIPPIYNKEVNGKIDNIPSNFLVFTELKQAREKRFDDIADWINNLSEKIGNNKKEK